VKKNNGTLKNKKAQDSTSSGEEMDDMKKKIRLQIANERGGPEHGRSFQF